MHMPGCRSRQPHVLAALVGSAAVALACVASQGSHGWCSADTPCAPLVARLLQYVFTAVPQNGGPAGTVVSPSPAPPLKGPSPQPQGTPPPHAPRPGRGTAVVDRGAGVQRAREGGEGRADGPAGAQDRIKRLAYAAQDSTMREQLDDERNTLIERMYGEECGAGISAFVDKRPPRFRE